MTVLFSLKLGAKGSSSVASVSQPKLLSPKKWMQMVLGLRAFITAGYTFKNLVSITWAGHQGRPLTEAHTKSPT